MTDDAKPLISESSTAESSRVDSVLKDFAEGTILIPDYQRDSDQWDETTKSLLIESVINNLSIPAFFFEVEVDEKGIERNQVIDGQQRLTTLKSFFDRKFQLVDSNDAPYISPNSVHYAGKTYDELPPVYRQAFDKYRLAIIKLRDLRDMRLEVFRRINQGGTPLSGQDIRLAYYGENSPTVTFIRLAGIYDTSREAAKRFIEKANTAFGLQFPWKAQELLAWNDLWDEKDLARGQTASEMFLWALMSAHHTELSAILQNADTVRKLGVTFNREIDGAMDVYCAQSQAQDHAKDSATPVPPVLITFEEMKEKFFPHFADWIRCLGTFGSSLDVRKYRTAASIIGAAYRVGIDTKSWNAAKWARPIEFIRRPTDPSTSLGIVWPQSKGRWDGVKGYRAQMEAAAKIAEKFA
ncbi:MAG: DUF262 domain-containing protein [Hyphomonadaceae bacterium]|nr:DUF262 domain-containing protein [Hyphomonadaceae bacterium]